MKSDPNFEDTKEYMCKCLPYIEYEEWEILYKRLSTIYKKDHCSSVNGCDSVYYHNKNIQSVVREFIVVIKNCIGGCPYDPRFLLESELRKKFDSSLERAVYRILFETKYEDLPTRINSKISFNSKYYHEVGPLLINTVFEWRLNCVGA